MFNSYNAHIVTRTHSDIVRRYDNKTITAVEAGEELQDFDINEDCKENRIHDTAIINAEHHHFINS